MPFNFYFTDNKELRIAKRSKCCGSKSSIFYLQNLEEATDGFKQELGMGAFGSVYKGLVEEESRNHIAVKKLKVINKGEKAIQS